MYDIKTIEFGRQQHPPKSSDVHFPSVVTANKGSSCEAPPHLTKSHSTCSIISTFSGTSRTSNSSDNSQYLNPAEATHMTLLSLRRRRVFQRRACLLSIVAAFVLGLALGVFMPVIGLAHIFGSLGSLTNAGSASSNMPLLPEPSAVNKTQQLTKHLPDHFPTVYTTIHEDLESRSQSKSETNTFGVAFIKEPALPAEEVFRNAFHLEQDKNVPDSLIVKKLDANDGSIKEFHVQRTSDGLYRKGPERRLSRPSFGGHELRLSHEPRDDKATDYSLHFVPMAKRIAENVRNQHHHGIIKSDIFWGDLVERALPKGFSAEDANEWNRYVSRTGSVDRLETGCGRMQNRMVIFKDGTRACARYRQNTDQIQGELFSFYLGQVLNLSNLAPSAASVVDLESQTWSSVVNDITQAQWKQQRPVVLTRWLPDLEPAGIPKPFQPLERHLNKYDVWNITLAAAGDSLKKSSYNATPSSFSPFGTTISMASTVAEAGENSLIKRLKPAGNTDQAHHPSLTDREWVAFAALNTPSPLLRHIIELAQWSDLIVFDYLIANLDRVVNNLYNYQWNADIMAAPAHNLARQINSQLLVFLDNESGLLHGYRLLKKYEAYHGLLLDNLCVFRQPTIEALQQLRAYGAGRRLRELFEETTTAELRDVLPSLPDKSIKILIDRIDRVLGQVQKCQNLMTER